MLRNRNRLEAPHAAPTKLTPVSDPQERKHSQQQVWLMLLRRVAPAGSGLMSCAAARSCLQAERFKGKGNESKNQQTRQAQMQSCSQRIDVVFTCKSDICSNTNNESVGAQGEAEIFVQHFCLAQTCLGLQWPPSCMRLLVLLLMVLLLLLLLLLLLDGTSDTAATACCCVRLDDKGERVLSQSITYFNYVP
jgi:hypothetical protein